MKQAHVAVVMEYDEVRDVRAFKSKIKAQVWADKQKPEASSNRVFSVEVRPCKIE